LIVYLHRQLHIDWRAPLKWAPWWGQIPKPGPKMTPNIYIMLKSYQFGPLDNTKKPQNYI